MKNSLKLFFILLFISILLIACNVHTDLFIDNNTDTTPSDEDNLLGDKNKVISVCFLEYPPYEYIEDGEFKGPGYDMIVEAFKRAQINATFEFLPWSRILKSIENGTKDVVVDAYMTDERKEYMYYSNTVYVSYPEVLFIRKNSDIKFDGTAESLKNFKIGINRDTSHGENFNKIINSGLFEIEEVNDPKMNFEKLANSRIDAIIDTLTVGEATIKEKQLEDKIIPVFPVLDNNFSYVGFSKKNNLIDIRDKYDEAIKSMEEDGTIGEIFKSYNLDNPRSLNANE